MCQYGYKLVHCVPGSVLVRALSLTRMGKFAPHCAMGAPQLPTAQRHTRSAVQHTHAPICTHAPCSCTRHTPCTLHCTAPHTYANSKSCQLPCRRGIRNTLSAEVTVVLGARVGMHPPAPTQMAHTGPPATQWRMPHMHGACPVHAPVQATLSLATVRLDTGMHVLRSVYIHARCMHYTWDIHAPVDATPLLATVSS